MENLSEYQILYMFVLPIILGIITTIVVFMGKSLISDTLIPLWNEKKSKTGHSVAGKWKADTSPVYDPKKKYEETIHIRQIGEDIIGDIFYREVEAAPTDAKIELSEKHFEFKGNFADLILSAVYYNTERRSRGRGTFCLLSKDEETLEGKYSWYEPNTNNIEAGNYIWKRIK